MKKHILLIFSLILVITIIACSNQNEEPLIKEQSTDVSNAEDKKPSEKMDVREVVWKQLNSEDKERIKGTWEDATVSKITLREDMMSLIDDKSYVGKEVYLIDFPTTNNFEPNNMLVYADIDTYSYIGHGLVE